MQGFNSVLEFLQHDLHIARVNAFRFLSRLPIAGIDQALVREGCVRQGEKCEAEGMVERQGQCGSGLNEAEGGVRLCENMACNTMVNE